MCNSVQWDRDGLYWRELLLVIYPVQVAHLVGKLAVVFSLRISVPHLLVISLTHCMPVTCSVVDIGTLPSQLSFGEVQAQGGSGRDWRG